MSQTKATGLGDGHTPRAPALPLPLHRPREPRIIPTPMTASARKPGTRLSLEMSIAALGVLGTVLLGVSLAWNIGQIRGRTLEEALIQARVAYGKDIVFRRWNNNHGGIYVDARVTPPNPYLSRHPRARHHHAVGQAVDPREPGLHDAAGLRAGGHGLGAARAHHEPGADAPGERARPLGARRPRGLRPRRRRGARRAAAGRRGAHAPHAPADHRGGVPHLPPRARLRAGQALGGDQRLGADARAARHRVEGHPHRHHRPPRPLAHRHRRPRPRGPQPARERARACAAPRRRRAPPPDGSPSPTASRTCSSTSCATTCSTPRASSATTPRTSRSARPTRRRRSATSRSRASTTASWT